MQPETVAWRGLASRGAIRAHRTVYRCSVPFFIASGM